METLDEVALRKPGFREGIRVPLADGQEWAFPPIMLETYSEMGAGGEVVIHENVPTYGPDHDADLDLILNIEADLEDHFRAALRMATKLLAANYGLPPNAYRRLLPWKSDGSTAEMWSVVIAAVQGYRPKPSAAGSD